ncbi:hypothetical protein HSISS2_4 [Streptococcus sp. HSISS2]|nr:hypothetical protein HSISS2_4 [Streptococcus sp. HSISS2]
MKVSQVLKEIRQKHGLTQDDLAQKLHVSRSAIVRWESEVGLPDIGNLLTISETFHTSLEKLIKEDKAVKEKVVRDNQIKNGTISFLPIYWRRLSILPILPWFTESLCWAS